MKTITIKTYRMNSKCSSFSFYILSQGLNSGKPQKSPCSNCFVIRTSNEEEKKKIYWICYSLWISGSYIPYLRGSVIPFLHISDASALIEKVYKQIDFNLQDTKALFLQLGQIIHLEKQLALQQKLVNELKRSLAGRISKYS